MSPRRRLLDVEYSDRFRERLISLDATRRAAAARVIAALVEQETTSGRRVKPILPAKVYYEARIASGDRLVFRIEQRTLYLIDIVHHDEIDRYSRRPKRGR
jgi:mRNA-degrading endonuclease RelE of RelBE toxin-antitoxin system